LVVPKKGKPGGWEERGRPPPEATISALPPKGGGEKGEEGALNNFQPEEKKKKAEVIRFGISAGRKGEKREKGAKLPLVHQRGKEGEGGRSQSMVLGGKKKKKKGVLHPLAVKRKKEGFLLSPT